MELDIESEMTEHSESTLTKQASPTTEKPVEGASNGFYGDNVATDDVEIAAGDGDGAVESQTVISNNLELDIESEMTEHSESTLTKQASPTTERPVKRASNGFYGDNVASDDVEIAAGDGDGAADSQTVISNNSHHDGDHDKSTTDAIDCETSEPLHTETPATLMEETAHSDSDGDMPPLEYTEDDKKQERISEENKVVENSEEPSTDGKNALNQEEWLDILGNGLLKKKVVVAGAGRDSRPVRSDRVTVDIEGHLEDGTEVDCHTGVQANLGEGDFNQALDMCIALMEKGETCELQTDPKYAYGSVGLEPSIPADAGITYTVKLHDVRPAIDVDDLSIQERIELGNSKRERGNFYFTRNEHPQALSCYTKALELLRRPDRSDGDNEVDEDLLHQLMDVEAKCYNNLAAAQIKMEAYDAAVKSCDHVIRTQPNNVKALFRKGKALGQKGDLDSAIPVLRQALNIEPESKLIHTELARLVGQQKGEANRERELYKKMLGQDKSPPQPENGSNTTLVILGVLAVLLSIVMAALLYQNRDDLL